MTFDLMKEKPKLDIPTLNYIWDGLCRKNLVSQNKNADQRSCSFERGRIMQELVYYADLEEKSI